MKTKARAARDKEDKKVGLSKPGKNQRLVDADGQLCPYCTRTMDRSDIKLMPTADHIRAKSKTQKGKKGRTIIVCSECNFMKNTMTLEEYIYNLIDRNKKLLSAVDNNLNRMRNIRYLLDIGLDKE